MSEHLVMIDQFKILDRDARILSSGNLQINQGSTMAIFGPGGSGKSLLLKFLYGQKLDGLTYQCQGFWVAPGLTYFLDRNKDKTSPVQIPSENYDLYLIDEPENGYSLTQFKAFQQKINANEGTLVFVTHHLGFLESFADEIMVLKYGESKGIYTRESFFNNEDPYIDYLSKMGC